MNNIHNLPTVTQSQESEGDDMPQITNLEISGLHQSSHLEAAQNKNGLSFTSILATLCTFGIILSTCLEPAMALLMGQAAVNSLIHKCSIVKSNFGNTLNSFPVFVLMAGEENNESCTFKKCLASQTGISS